MAWCACFTDCQSGDERARSLDLHTNNSQFRVCTSLSLSQAGPADSAPPLQFRDEASLDGALQLNGTQLMGRAIKVGYAQAKKNHNGGA